MPIIRSYSITRSLGGTVEVSVGEVHVHVHVHIVLCWQAEALELQTVDYGNYTCVLLFRPVCYAYDAN